MAPDPFLSPPHTLVQQDALDVIPSLCCPTWWRALQQWWLSPSLALSRPLSLSKNGNNVLTALRARPVSVSATLCILQTNSLLYFSFSPPPTRNTKPRCYSCLLFFLTLKEETYFQAVRLAPGGGVRFCMASPSTPQSIRMLSLPHAPLFPRTWGGWRPSYMRGICVTSRLCIACTGRKNDKNLFM